jgi:hypothetical protein
VVEQAEILARVPRPQPEDVPEKQFDGDEPR